MPTPDLGRDERELEQFIHESAEPVAVFLGEPLQPLSQRIGRALAEAAPRLGIALVHVNHGSYIDWAAMHDILGSPVVVLFRNGLEVYRHSGTGPAAQDIEAILRRVKDA